MAVFLTFSSEPDDVDNVMELEPDSPLSRSSTYTNDTDTKSDTESCKNADVNDDGKDGSESDGEVKSLCKIAGNVKWKDFELPLLPYKHANSFCQLLCILI